MVILLQYFCLLALLLAPGLVLPPAASAESTGQSSAQASPQASTPSSSAVPSTAAPATPSPGVTTDPETLGDLDTIHQHYQAAIAEYSKVPKMTASILNKMGIAYQMMFNYKSAADCYEKSIRLEPTNAEVLNNLATVYGAMKNHGAADRMYRRALKLNPKSALILKNYGTSLMTEHKYSKGWEEYQQALAIDPAIFASHDGPMVQDAAPVNERGAMNYYMAVGCARAGYTDCALEYLRNALNEGYTSPKKVAADNDFASLRGNAAFQQLLAEQRHQ